jgi:hypothetical protein
MAQRNAVPSKRNRHACEAAAFSDHGRRRFLDRPPLAADNGPSLKLTRQFGPISLPQTPSAFCR